MNDEQIPEQPLSLYPWRLPTRLIGDPRPENGLAGLLARTAAEYGLTVSDLESTRATPRIAHPRQDFFWRARQVKWADGRHRYSYPMIGRYFLGKGGRDKPINHTTVIHGERRHEERLRRMEEAEAA